MHKSIFKIFENFKSKNELKEFFSIEIIRWDNQERQFAKHNVVFGEISKFTLDFKEIIKSIDSDSFVDDLFDLYHKYNFPSYDHFIEILNNKIVNSYNEAGAIYLVVLANNGVINLTQNELAKDFVQHEIEIARSEISESKNLSLTSVRSVIAEIRLKDVSARLKEYEKNIDKLKLTSESEFENFTKDIGEKFREMLENYETAAKDKLELRTAVTYWYEKSKRHQYTSYAVLCFLGSTLCGFAWLVWNSFCYYLDNYNLLMENKEKFAFLDGHIKYLLLGASFTLFVWMVRVFLKVWLSQVHMRNDASERVVMVQTYLALMADGAVQNNEDRSVVINALFRSTSDGIVKDDGMPNPIIELITKNK